MKVASCGWADFGALVDHLPTSGNHALYTASLALNSDGPVRDVRLPWGYGEPVPFRSGRDQIQHTIKGSGASGSASMPIALIRE